MSSKSPYRVGYRKPPKETQFKKGQSGNPKGRPKGTCNLDVTIEGVMSEEMRCVENGRKRRRPAIELILLHLRQRALKGDNKATEMILRYYQQSMASRSSAEPIDHLLDEDKAILEGYNEQNNESASCEGEAERRGGEDE